MTLLTGIARAQRRFGCKCCAVDPTCRMPVGACPAEFDWLAGNNIRPPATRSSHVGIASNRHAVGCSAGRALMVVHERTDGPPFPYCTL
jgi:hypothetical protein